MWVAATLSILLLLLVSPPVRGQEKKTAVLFDANESPPYWSQDLPHGGLCGEILQVVSRQAGLESTIAFKPLARLFEGDENNVTGNPMFYLADREFEAVIPIALYYSALFYYRPSQKDKITFSRLSDLRGYRIGVLKGTVVDRPYFDKAGVTFEESYSEKSLFKKLKLGRLDVCICIDLVGHMTIRELFPEEASDFALVQIPRSVTPIAIMLAEKYPNGKTLAHKYREGLRTVITNGTYGGILERYYGKGKIPASWFNALARFADMYDMKGNTP